MFRQTCVKIRKVSIRVISNTKCSIAMCPIINYFMATSYLMFQGTSRYCMPSVLTNHFYSTSHIKLYSLEPMSSVCDICKYDASSSFNNMSVTCLSFT